MQKPHKDDYLITKAYRPIALLDIIGKALESVLAKKISALTELHGLLPKTHFGGRRGTSTEHAIHYLLEKIYKGWHQGKDTSSLMLDVTGAFDNVSHERLLHNLKKRRIDLKIVDWISSFISNRSTIIKTNKCVSDDIQISTGIPQESSLSPILYLFYNADLIEICCTTNGKVTAGGFINDVFLLATSSSISENCQLLKKTHLLCMAWANRHGSKFDPLKYQLVHLSRKRNADLKTNLVLSDSHTIKAKTLGVLLGIKIDNGLRWKQHVERIKMKATTSITALSCRAGSIWEGQLKTIRALYQAIVLPQITYCCSAWYSPPGLPSHRKYILKSLQTIQRRASRIITGAFKARLLPALDIETFLLPIGLKLDKLASGSLLQIVFGQLYETIISNRPKPAQSKQLSPLECLIRQFEERSSLSIANLERTVPFIAPPWWVPPKTTIAPNKSEAKQNHDQLA